MGCRPNTSGVFARGSCSISSMYKSRLHSARTLSFALFLPVQRFAKIWNFFWKLKGSVHQINSSRTFKTRFMKKRPNDPILHSLNRSENQSFSGVFKENKVGTWPQMAYVKDQLTIFWENSIAPNHIYNCSPKIFVIIFYRTIFRLIKWSHSVSCLMIDVNEMDMCVFLFFYAGHWERNFHVILFTFCFYIHDFVWEMTKWFQIDRTKIPAFSLNFFSYYQSGCLTFKNEVTGILSRFEI